jgi:hypothetical protein
MSTSITPNFTVEEWVCHDGQAYPVDTVEDGSGIPTGWTPPEGAVLTWRWSRLQPLGLTLQAIRDKAAAQYNLSGAAAGMVVDSGYRDEAYDEKLYNAHVAAVGDDGMVAAASVSIHPKGGAADMKHATLTPTQLFTLALTMYAAGELPYLGGAGLYPSFCHFDVRTRTNNGQHLAIWGGHRPSNIA